jgi:hypothetical protein
MRSTWSLPTRSRKMIAPSRGMSRPVFFAQGDLEGPRSFDNVRARPSLRCLQDLSRTTIPIRSRLPPRLHETDKFGGVLEGHEQHSSATCRPDRVRQQLLKVRCPCHAPIPPDGAIIREALARRHLGIKSGRRTRQSAASLPFSLRALKSRRSDYPAIPSSPSASIVRQTRVTS